MRYNTIKEILISNEWEEFIKLENEAAEIRLANMSLRERMAEAMDNMVGPQDGVVNMIAGKSTSGSMIDKFLAKYQSNVNN